VKSRKPRHVMLREMNTFWPQQLLDVKLTDKTQAIICFYNASVYLVKTAVSYLTKLVHMELY